MLRSFWMVLLISLGGVFASEKGLRTAPVTLKLNGTPLLQGLEQFQEKTGIVLVFGNALLDGIHVTCNFKNQPAHIVLDGLLQGTPLKARWVSDNRVVLHRLDTHGLMTINGRVLASQTSGPLAGVRVGLKGTSRETLTDRHGNFEFTKVPREGCILVLEAEGFIPQSLAAGQVSDTWTPKVLLVGAPKVKERLLVTSGLGKAMAITLDSGGVQISPDGMDAQGAPIVDLFESLRRIPGVDMLELGETGLSIRGSAPSDNLVMLDGIKLYQLDHSLGYISALNGEAIGNINLYKGAPPARYGERTAGVLDLNTRDVGERISIGGGIKGETAHLTLELPMGPYAALLLSARRSFDEEQAHSIYDRVYERTFNEASFDFQDDDNIRADRALRFSDITGKLTFKAGDNDTISVTFYDGWDRTDELVDIDINRGTVRAYEKHGRWGNEGYALSWDHDFGRGGKTRAQYTSSTYSTDFNTFLVTDWDDILTESWLYKTILEDKGFQLSHTVDIGRNTLEVGLGSTRLSAYFEENSSDFYDFWNQQNSLRSYYAQYTMRATDRFGLNLGLRHQQDKNATRGGLEPRFSLWLQLNEHLTARFGYGRQHQYILRSPDTLNYFEGVITWFVADRENGDIKAGFSEQEQWGLLYQKDNWLIEGWAFRKKQEGSVLKVFDPLKDRPDLEQTRDRIHGAEILLRHRLGFFNWELGYTWREDRVISDIDRETRLNYLGDRDTPHQLKLAAYLQKGNWKWEGSFSYASGRPYSIPDVVSEEIFEDLLDYELDEEEKNDWHLAPSRNPNNKRLPENHRLDLGLRYVFTFRGIVAEVGATIINAYDRDNTLYRYYELDYNPEFDSTPEIYPVDVKGFEMKPVIDLRTRF